MKQEIEQILLQRHYVVCSGKGSNKSAYYNAYLLSNFGIVLDRPEFADRGVISSVKNMFALDIPVGFYSNPQDTKYFSQDELFIEQLVSYFVYESGNFDVARLEVFKKDLPQYVKGDELVLRTVNVITEADVKNILTEIMSNFYSYTRPWSLQEFRTVQTITESGIIDKTESIPACRDNILLIIFKYRDYNLFSYVDKKDLVKASVETFGEHSGLRHMLNYLTADVIDMFKVGVTRVKDCPLSKKQAKYFNTLCKLTGVTPDNTNAKSPYKLATKELKSGNVVAAAKVYAANGSLLERNIRMLLSRANTQEAAEILDMIPDKNPIVLTQLVSKLSTDTGTARTFTFKRKNLVIVHTETEYETKWRKSRLSQGQTKELVDICTNKFDNHYSNSEKLGKVYVSSDFEKVALPTNTSASGTGIDVFSTGSRIPCESKKIRSFVYWNNVFDIDASLILVKEDGTVDIINWYDYASNMSDAIRFSGDDRRESGAEYYDLDLELIKAKGYKYVVQAINGYAGTLNIGEIKAGYQAKEDFNTEVWDPKNIAFEYTVQGNTRSSVNFGIDLTTNEVVILNLMVESRSRVVDDSALTTIMQYLDPSFLKLNVARIARLRGTEVVDAPEEADVVFDNNYQAKENQQVIRAYNVEKLVKLL